MLWLKCFGPSGIRFLGSRHQGQGIFFNLIILLDLPYDSGQNKISFVKIKTRVQLRLYQIVSYLPCIQAKKLVAVNRKIIAAHIRF